MQVNIRIGSDSGNPADLDEVYEGEVVSEPRDRSPSLNGFPKWPLKVQEKLQRVTEVDLDWHRLNVMGLRAMLQTHLQGQFGEWSQDQFDEFTCKRCGMQGRAVIPESGYRITRVVEIDGQGQLWLTLRKYPLACEIGGRSSAAGPSLLVESRMRVPLSGQVGGFGFP